MENKTTRNENVWETAPASFRNMRTYLNGLFDGLYLKGMDGEKVNELEFTIMALLEDILTDYKNKNDDKAS